MLIYHSGVSLVNDPRAISEHALVMDTFRLKRSSVLSEDCFLDSGAYLLRDKPIIRRRILTAISLLIGIL